MSAAPNAAVPPTCDGRQLSIFAIERTASKHGDRIAALAPIAAALAKQAGAAGITVGELRAEAVRRGLLTGEEQGRQLSFLGAVMRQAGLVNAGELRRSPIPRSHGNRHVVWRAPPAR